jgi:hypothetical protein
MALATDSDVRAYVEMAAGVDTAPYITAASAVVTAHLASSGLSTAIKTQVEIMLACHFATLAVERGGLRKEAMGDANQSYQTISEKYTGFNSTRFGQSAIALDSSGTLAVLGITKPRAQFRVVGNADTDNAS